MSIKKISKNRYNVVARIRKDNKIVHRQKTITGTKEDAKALLEKMKQEIRSGASLCSLKSQNDISTFRDVLDLYCSRLYDASESHKRKIAVLKNDLGNVMIDIFPDSFQEYLNIIKTTPTKQGKARSNASLNRMY